MKSGGYEMTINERLEFFKEMLRCNYDVYLWTYTPERSEERRVGKECLA